MQELVLKLDIKVGEAEPHEIDVNKHSPKLLKIKSDLEELNLRLTNAE